MTQLSIIAWQTITRSLDGFDGQFKTLNLHSDPKPSFHSNDKLGLLSYMAIVYKILYIVARALGLAAECTGEQSYLAYKYGHVTRLSQFSPITFQEGFLTPRHVW